MSVFGNNPESSSSSLSFDDIRKLNNAGNFERAVIGWYRRKDILEHTGIVVTINDKKFTLDYTRHSNFVLSYSYNMSTSKYKGELTRLNKEQLNDFLDYCERYDRDYNLVMQNCRDFTRSAVTYLRKQSLISNDSMKEFEHKLKNASAKDASKVVLPTAAVAGAVVGGPVGAAAGLAVGCAAVVVGRLIAD